MMCVGWLLGIPYGKSFESSEERLPCYIREIGFYCLSTIIDPNIFLVNQICILDLIFSNNYKL